ncbi:MAG: PadR family transcriptional regulator [Oscillospiraceae bacterium]|nr:PadR family transcriptional regulator [Oscillospiraceae bacterium]
MLDYIALGMVLREPLTGYDIKKEIEKGIGLFYTVSYGSLYPALKKLTAKGYLTMTEQPQGSRVKKYYAATELGKATFLEWLSSPFEPTPSSAPLLAKIYFFGELPEDMRRRQLKECELYYQQVLRKLQIMEKRFADLTMTDRIYFELSTLYFGLQHFQNSVRWFGHISEKKPLSEFIRKEDTI